MMVYMNRCLKKKQIKKLMVKTAKLGCTFYNLSREDRSSHSKNLKIGENIAYEMLKGSIKRIFGFLKFSPEIRNLSFLAK